MIAKHRKIPVSLHADEKTLVLYNHEAGDYIDHVFYAGEIPSEVLVREEGFWRAYRYIGEHPAMKGQAYRFVLSEYWPKNTGDALAQWHSPVRTQLRDSGKYCALREASARRLARDTHKFTVQQSPYDHGNYGNEVEEHAVHWRMDVIGARYVGIVYNIAEGRALNVDWHHLWGNGAYIQVTWERFESVADLFDRFNAAGIWMVGTTGYVIPYNNTVPGTVRKEGDKNAYGRT